MPDYSRFYEARDIISDVLSKDLIGPVTTDEVLSELPTQYYIMGKLYPQGDTDPILDMARNPLLENEADAYDASVSLSNQRTPSSMAITCCLKKGVSSIILSGSYAFYESIDFGEAAAHQINTDKWSESEVKPNELWIRHVYPYEQEIALSTDKAACSHALEGGLELRIYTHHISEKGERIITVVLINTNVACDHVIEKAQKCVFQPILRITGPENRPIFCNVNRQSEMATDAELLELEMLYSDIICYAQGHGCSVEWDRKGEEPVWVESAWMPGFNLLQMKAGETGNKKVLSMKYLSEANPEEMKKSLLAFISDYDKWIDQLENNVKILSDRYKESAGNNVKKCRAASSRMKRSVDAISENTTDAQLARRAFQLANEAMLLQRCQTLKKNGKSYKEESITWYPFQLAFILHEIICFVKPKAAERDTVDLLWFPTGGGKTEAYLGIAAFVIFLRRLRNSSDDGVTIIMRYTLRLLTLQQFERASILILSCEMLREKYQLGGSEISIGLWVGDKLTPNSLAKARSSINKQKRGALISADESNPCQIVVCPWCGKEITSANYSVPSGSKRMLIKCSNPLCEFHNAENGLPVHIIDEAIYAQTPTFVVATVDKFAQIPLSDKPAALLGISNQKNPPELIIQDELHLISGPLGTMTGIYEAAITRLCEKDGVRAKVIASTATIRNAKNQIRALYARDYTQFPPQGITAKDSYFAKQSTEKDKPARKYHGVMGIGVTATTSLIRVNAALLFATRYLAALGFEDEVVDNFWTLTGYFNSLRELGGASTQILDDVQSRFSYLANTKFAHLKPEVDQSSPYDYIQELTSRMNNSEITTVIQDKLKRSYRADNHKDVYDFVLATNMISVGVDVGRLGIMTVTGQPKTNAEYIQATSRVGRDNPGLVITVYNPTRSRDRSHYEQFTKYHSQLYRYVEATSLTPFSDRARDRGLHALYVSLCRYQVPGLLSNDSAVNYDPDNDDVMKITDEILDYVMDVDPDEVDNVAAELEDIASQWEQETTGTLVYRSFNGEKELLKGDTDRTRFRTMNSMRNVDVQSGIYLLGR